MFCLVLLLWSIRVQAATTMSAAAAAAAAAAASEHDCYPSDPVLSEAISTLVEKGATWNNKDGVLSHVAYGDDPMQAVDVYFPETLLLLSSQSSPPPPLVHNNNKVPVYIHIHGGGWSRGGKASTFYGGPALSKNAAKCGLIAVSVGYRLGTYPHFMEDCANAIKFVRENIAMLGGDVNQVFLSGHSAGGHIASLLLLRHSTFLEPVGIPLDFFSGLILVSGVYDLFSPLRAAPIDVKNKWFFIAYVLPAFGYDEKLRRQASPVLLLSDPKPSIEDEAEEDNSKDTSLLGKLAQVVENYFRTSEEEDDDHPVVNTSHLPRTLILNADFDMGLQQNGELMAAEMAKYTDVKYVLVKGTNHADICWNEKSTSEISKFLLDKPQEEP